MTGQVLSNGNVTDAFEISYGVKQGCILALVLFNVFFTRMLSHAVQDLEKGVYIRYHLDGSLFNLHRLTAKTRSLQTLLQEVLFADDCALVLHQPAPYCQTPPTPTTTIDNKPLANVEHFKYLGSNISRDGSLDIEIDTRISKASQILDSLHNRVLSKYNIRLSMKLKVYNTMVLPSLLYGCETWTLYHRHIKKLELFHMRTLRSILGIR